MTFKPLPVLLSVTGQSQIDGMQEDSIHLVTTGTLTALPNGYQLDYQESHPDGTDSQDISLIMEKSRVTMTRRGEYGASMVFEKGRRFQSIYRTPYGDMDMAIYATRVHCRLYDDQGDVHLQYQLDLQGQFAAMHDLTVHYVDNSPRDHLS